MRCVRAMRKCVTAFVESGMVAFRTSLGKHDKRGALCQLVSVAVDHQAVLRTGVKARHGEVIFPTVS